MQISRRCASSVLALPGMMASASIDLSLCVDPAEFKHKGDTVNGQHISGDAIIHAVGLRVAYHFVEAVLHNIFQPFIDSTLAPEKAFAVLHPFEVAHCDAARVRQDVRDDEDSLG